MAITLDPATEQRIQRELEFGNRADAVERKADSRRGRTRRTVRKETQQYRMAFKLPRKSRTIK
jgi:hypothetical protein